jgi:hypothetical protein
VSARRTVASTRFQPGALESIGKDGRDDLREKCTEASDLR